jgi:uncharacterized protein YqhQ
MFPVVALTNQDIKKIADCLFGQIEVEDSSDQQLNTTFSAINAEVDITAMFFCGSVTVESYKAIDEDSKEMAMTIATSVLLAVGLFIVLPTWSMRFLHTLTNDPMLLNLAEGVLRMMIFLIYIASISAMEDIQRVFQYHGAEHKTIYCYEAGLPLEVDNVRDFTTLHPRCGTNFLMIVMMISMFVFTFLGWPNLFERIASRVILMPVIAGISYEIIRFAGAHCDNPIVHCAIMPGLALQKLTTRQPDDSQIEVAIASLKAVLPEYAEKAKNEEASAENELNDSKAEEASEINETPEENNLQEKTTND